MIVQFSPFTRRLIALALLFLALLGLLNLVVLPIAALISTGFSDLADARFRLARLEAIKERALPPEAPPVPMGLALIAPDEPQAVEQLRTQLTVLAARYQLRLEASPAPPSETPIAGRIALAIAVSGAQEPLLNFVNSLEQGEPLIRLKTWRLARDSGGAAGPASARSALQEPAPMPGSPPPPPPGFDPNAGAGVGGGAPVAGAAAPAQPMPSPGPGIVGQGSSGQGVSGQPVRLDAVAVAAWARRP